MPALAPDFITPRAETGHGLDASSEYGEVARADLDQPAMTILTGPSGYGKTHLAAAFLARLARSGTSDVQVWINASSRWAVMVGHAQAARDISLTYRGVHFDAGVARFQDWLSETDSHWLVVYDNVTSLSELADQWPATPNGQVLVTCRHGIQSSDLANLSGLAPRICPVGEFSPREALNYLAARLHDDPHERVQALDLAADLGFMPLALKLATSTIASTTLNCSEYRRRLAARSQDLAAMTADGLVSPAAAAASLALDLADKRPPMGLAHAVLALFALLEAHGVPVQVPMSRAACGFFATRAHAVVDPKHVWAAVGNLVQSGLVIVDQSCAVPLIMVHPAVQGAILRIIPGTVLAPAALAAADAIAEVLPQFEADPHLMQTLGDSAARLSDGAGDLLWRPEPHPVIASAGHRLGTAGLAGSAIGYWHSLLEASRRVLGPADLETLAVRDSLASACDAAARVDDAVALARASVADREQIQGSAHPDTTAARTALAGYGRTAGRFDLAIDAGERALADRERTLGTSHLDTLAARSQLATTYRLAGQFDKAIMLHQQNLSLWTRLLGPQHSDVLAEHLNLAHACRSAGRSDEAIAIFRKVWTARQQSLGGDHPDTLAACGHLAYAYRTAGRMKEAIPCYRQTLAGREATLGPDHPDTLTALANLAFCYHSAHRMKDAIPLYERLLADRERIQGPDHPDTLTTRGNLAGGYDSAGRLADALPVYERTVADFERVLGPDHPDTLTSRGNLAHAYYMARRRTDSLAVFEQTLADSERALGPDHPLTQTIRENLKVASRLAPFLSAVTARARSGFDGLASWPWRMA